ncbi:MAG: glycosyltransferase [Clostridiaceae bacterium]|nr:glycosyltransferase [Clostridiaceae bacterium]
MAKISVIVPVFKVEKYIEQCINSIINQSIKDIEIIIIDDESPDRSIEIVKAINDDRIKIINQKNKGLSGARNTGIRAATGEYIAFVDSDDYLAFNTAYEEMYNIAIEEGSDIVAGNCIWFYSDKNNYPMERNKNYFNKTPMDSEEFYINSLKTKRIFAPVWLNLYKKKLFDENDLYFKEGIYHEDEEFTPRALLLSNKISIYDKEFYVYRQREGSIVNSGLNLKRCEDLLDTCLFLSDLADKTCNNELKRLLKNYIANIGYDLIYKHKYEDVSQEIKQMLSRNSQTKLHKFRSKVLNIDVNLYITTEKFIKFIKYINNSFKLTKGAKY